MNCKKCDVPLSGQGLCPKCGGSSGFYVAVTPSGADTPAASAGSPKEVADDRLVLDGYQILRTLGMGGVGVVYLARAEADGKLYALKVLRPSFIKNAEVRTRFNREVEVAKKLKHPNIAPVLGLKESRGNLFIVMDYVEGVDLGQYIRAETVSLERKLGIMKAVCAAIDAAHAANVVHRDLKPGNILIARDGTPYVCDFGVAHADGEVSVTRPGSFIGTPLYVSPEQAQGKRVDSRSDIYSLGAIFYELMTGRPPFIGDSAITIALKHIRETPFRPRNSNPDIPPVVERVILQCLEKDPSSRPQKASDIIAEIERPIERHVRAAVQAAKTMAQEAGSGDLREVSLFQYLRVIAPIKRNFVLEIVNNAEFGRYYFRGAHLVHAESGNLRDDEVAYNLFYWGRGNYRVVTDAEPPARESVSIPWIPFVERYFESIKGLILGAHGVIEGAIIVDLLDPKGSSVYRYRSDSRFEQRLGDKAKLPIEAFRRGRAHLKTNDVRKITKTSDDGGQLFCYSAGLGHYFYILTEPGADIEALYRWLKNELEQGMVEALHDSLIASDRKRGAATGGLRVLIAEDQEFLGNLVRIKLRSLGMDVYLVRDGNKVLEIAPQFRPDVIVLNVNVRGVSGQDICRSLGANPALSRVPVILLLPNEQSEIGEDAWPVGVVRTVGKPIVLAELVELVERYAAKRRPAVGRKPDLVIRG